MKRTNPLTLAASLAFAMAFTFSCSSVDDELDGVLNFSSGGVALCNGEEYYLGYGYDVISSGYINRGDVKVSHPILDQGKMCKDGVITTASASEQDFKIFTGSSIREFYNERNASINLSLGSGITSVFFSGKFQSEFSASNSTSENSVTYYSRVRSYRYTQDDYIKDATLENLSNYLTESFVSSLQSKTAKEILDQYGTHVFIRYFKGGSLEANYTYTGSGLTSTSAVKAAVEASYAGISGGVSGSATTGKAELESKSSFKYYTYGGEALGATSMEQLKNEYGTWVNSIAGNSDICGIGNFENSFISIWDLAKAAGEISVAAELESEFKKRAAEQGIAFPLAKFFKTTEPKNYTSNSAPDLKSLVPAGATIAGIEIYALGAGGGGQGGNYSGALINEYGTGGSGGGGAAFYAKLGGLGLSAGASVPLNITIGAGGSGGSAYTSTATRSGSPGNKGGNTTVSWTTKSISISAEGGSGGGVSASDKLVDYGDGGRVTPKPSSNLITDWNSVVGKNGENGNFDKNGFRNTGGTAASVSGATVKPFGGGLGATADRAAGAGGGGSGGYYTDKSATAGKTGGSGLVTVVVHYFTEE